MDILRKQWLRALIQRLKIYCSLYRKLGLGVENSRIVIATQHAIPFFVEIHRVFFYRGKPSNFVFFFVFYEAWIVKLYSSVWLLKCDL